MYWPWHFCIGGDYGSCLLDTTTITTRNKRSVRLRSDHRGVNIVDEGVVDNMILKSTEDFDFHQRNC
jgi:hypothetical protein